MLASAVPLLVTTSLDFLNFKARGYTLGASSFSIYQWLWNIHFHIHFFSLEHFTFKLLVHMHTGYSEIGTLGSLDLKVEVR